MKVSDLNRKEGRQEECEEKWERKRTPMSA